MYTSKYVACMRLIITLTITFNIFIDFARFRLQVGVVYNIEEHRCKSSNPTFIVILKPTFVFVHLSNFFTS